MELIEEFVDGSKRGQIVNCNISRLIPSMRFTCSGTIVALIVTAVADLAMVPWVPWNPPFGLELLLRNTDDEPNGTLLSG